MKLGILGAGGIASTMAKTVAGMKGVEAYAVAARDLERARVFAQKYEVKKHMDPMRKCWQMMRLNWFISQLLIHTIICMQRCVWKRESMCFVKGIYCKCRAGTKII